MNNINLNYDRLQNMIDIENNIQRCVYCKIRIVNNEQVTLICEGCNTIGCFACISDRNNINCQNCVKSKEISKCNILKLGLIIFLHMSYFIMQFIFVFYLQKKDIERYDENQEEQETVKSGYLVPLAIIIIILLLLNIFPLCGSCIKLQLKEYKWKVSLLGMPIVFEITDQNEYKYEILIKRLYVSTGQNCSHDIFSTDIMWIADISMLYLISTTLVTCLLPLYEFNYLIVNSACILLYICTKLIKIIKKIFHQRDGLLEDGLLENEILENEILYSV